MEELSSEYLENRVVSKSVFERAKRVIPGGVCHNIRYFPPFPFYVERARGSKIWDVDGNSYIDYWMGHYAHIMGHGYSEVVDNVTRTISERGYHFGLVNKEEVDFAELILSVLSEFDMVRFCTSGSDAASFAVRLARAYTGKKKVLKAKGGWHGAVTELLNVSSYPFDIEESMGIPDEFNSYLIPIPFNNWEETERIIEENSEDIACAIVEPVLGAGGFLPGEREYLARLKEKLNSLGALLVFDEVITGFRVSLKGYYGLVGVVPDIITLGKVVGGGFPIGVVVSRKDIMEASSHFRKKPDRVLIGGGTFSCNIVSMVAGMTVVSKLIKEGGYIYSRISYLTEMLKDGIIDVAKKNSVPVRITGVGSLFKVHIMKEDREIREVDDIYKYTFWEEVDGFYRTFMVKNGINMVHLGGAISYAHSEEDIEKTINVFDRFFKWVAKKM